MDETELYDELDCLAGLVRTATTPQKIKRSWHYEYHCDPQQETKLIPGQSYRVHRDGKSLNLTLADLNLAQGKATIAIGEPTLKKLRDEEPNWDLPSRVSLLNHKPISCDHLTQAIADTVRQWHEQRQLQPALADFLERRSPRFHNGKTLVSLCSKQPTLSEIITALAQLDNSYLCIQGPPGSGKTYTAANIILSLLQQGKTIAVSANSHKVIVNLLERVYLYQQRQEPNQDSSQSPSQGANPALAIAKIASDGETKVPGIAFPTDLKDALPPTYQLVGATVYKFCRDIAIDQFDYLFIDEAGQVSLANLVAMARCAKNLVLIGDPLQLEQPLQGVHPGESGQSALGYLLNGRATIPPDLGIFLGTSYRMHPTLCRFISEAIYEGRLGHAQGTECHYIQLDKMQSHSKRSGLWFLPIEHDDNTQSSLEEVAAIDRLVQQLLGLPYQSDRGTKNGYLTPAEILVVAPYNLQVRKLQERLGDRARCGTVDKFQGQEAPVAIVSMTTSRVEDTARGLDFLLNRNRLNVAVSRAQCLAIVVASPALAKTPCSTLAQMLQVNLFCKLMAEAGTFSL